MNKDRILITRPRFTRRTSVVMMSGLILSSALGGGLARAAEETGKESQLEELVVTGTLIRGTKPIGSNDIALDSAAISEIAPATTNELLGSIPQVSNFFNSRPEQDPRGAGRNTVNRPNLRNLPGINDTSGATTLVLMDGIRQTPVGVSQSSFDPDMIPAIVMERVEIVTDGGTSLYGADAVGGVINFNTLDRFDGVKIDLGYDVGDDYDNWNGAVMAGTHWDRGSAYLALARSSRDAVLNKDRDWAPLGKWTPDGSELRPNDSQCDQAVGQITTWKWVPFGINVWTTDPRAGGSVDAVGSPCNTSLEGDYLPAQDRDWVFGGLTQDLTDSLSLGLKAYYAKRELTLGGFGRGGTISDPAPSGPCLNPDGSYCGFGTPYYQNALSFSYRTNPGYEHKDETLDIETMGITPELTWNFTDEWRLLTTLHYGQSKNTNQNYGVDTALQNAAVADGRLDPRNIAAADPALVHDILYRGFTNESEQELFSLRAVADGPLLTLPAGELRGAFGVQYSDEQAEVRAGDYAGYSPNGLEWNSNSRDVSSVFGELSIPVLDSLSLSASVRYDDYSDFGDTSNPAFGFSFRPIEWLEIFGHWSESFNAPTVLDPLQPGRVIGYYPGAASIVPDNGKRDPSRQDALLAEGAGGTLLPQTAETWAMGFNLEPIEGLRLNANYYDIDFINLLGAVNPQSSVAVEQNPDKFIFNPTQQQLDDFLAQLDNGADWAYLNPANIGVIVDRRIANTDQARLKGVDFSLTYAHDSSVGMWSYSLSGNRPLDFITTSNGVEKDVLEYEASELSAVASIGWEYCNYRASLRTKYSEGFKINPDSGAYGQESVDDFMVTDFYAAWDYDDSLTLSLNVDNVLDEEPPLFRQDGKPSYAFWTLGRVFKFNISKTF